MSVVLFLVAFTIGLDEFLLGPLLTPIGADLGVRPERVALFVAAYNLPLALLAPVFGAVSDRVGRRAVLLPAVLVFGLASLATAVAPSFLLGIAARLLTGVAAAGMLPVAFALASESGDSAAQISRVQAGLTLGIILGPLNGALMDHLGHWRLAFVALALLAALLALPLRRAGGKVPGPVAEAPGGGNGLWSAVPGLLGMGLGLGGAVGIFALLGERFRDLFMLDTLGISVIYAAFGAMTILGNLLMPVLARRAGPLAVAGACLLAVLAGILLLFGPEAALIGPTALALASWAIFGGAAAPALQAALAGAGGANRGLVLALGASFLNAGTAASSALASELHLLAPHWVAWQAAALIAPVALVLLWAARRVPVARAG